MRQLLPTFKGFLIFAVCGMAAEVFFNSFKSLYDKYIANHPLDFSLTGQTYIWMFFIYGSGFLLVDAAFPIFKQLLPKLIFRIPIYVLCIYIIEYVTGWGIAQIIGKCPWEYHSPFSIHGYINLSYTPFWAIFAIGLERLYFWTKRAIVI